MFIPQSIYVICHLNNFQLPVIKIAIKDLKQS